MVSIRQKGFDSESSEEISPEICPEITEKNDKIIEKHPTTPLKKRHTRREAQIEHNLYPTDSKGMFLLYFNQFISFYFKLLALHKVNLFFINSVDKN